MNHLIYFKTMIAIHIRTNLFCLQQKHIIFKPNKAVFCTSPQQITKQKTGNDTLGQKTNI